MTQAETPTSSKPNIETLIAAALQHGQDSEPDHEVGDLQNYFTDAWSLLSPEKRQELLLCPEVQLAIESATLADAAPVTEEMLGDEGYERLQAIFELHGTDEGPEAEVADYQQTLRACWALLTPEQRDEMLALETVQDTYEAATLKPLWPNDVPTTGFIATSGWSHIFVGNWEETTRWIYDCENKVLVGAQILSVRGWLDLDSANAADLLESIHDNEVTSDVEAFEDFDLSHFTSLPTWDSVEQASSLTDESEPALSMKP